MDQMNEYELVDACDQNLKIVVSIIDTFFKTKECLQRDFDDDERIITEITRLLTEILDFSSRADELLAAGGTKHGKRVQIAIYSPKYSKLILENAGKLNIKEFLDKY